MIYYPRLVLSIIVLIWSTASYIRTRKNAREFRRNGYNGAIALIYTQKKRYRIAMIVSTFVVLLSAFCPTHEVADRVVILTTVLVSLWAMISGAWDTAHLERIVLSYIVEKESIK